MLLSSRDEEDMSFAIVVFAADSEFGNCGGLRQPNVASKTQKLKTQN